MIYITVPYTILEMKMRLFWKI